MQSHRFVLQTGRAELVVIVNNSRFYFHTQVGGDIEVGQLRIYVCVDDRDQVNSDKCKYAEVPVQPATAVMDNAVAQNNASSFFLL